MFSDLILVHRNGSHAPLVREPGLLASFDFKTCLRQFVIIDADALSSIAMLEGDDVYRGIEAYRFVLQVICGLHSPLIGETEVSGQFKLAVAGFKAPASPWGQQIKRFFQNLFEDAKRVRQTHLVDLGSQSYGSVIRREFKTLPSIKSSPRKIHVVGAGHLVQEILPWIAKDGFDVHVHCRNFLKAEKALAGQAKLSLHNLDSDAARAEFGKDDIFVIAAPVTAQWIQNWIGLTPAVIADLRADSAKDLINLDTRVINLSHVFNHISETQAHLQARKAAALKAIDAAVHERNCYVEYRPFGWEDVCA